MEERTVLELDYKRNTLSTREALLERMKRDAQSFQRVLNEDPTLYRLSEERRPLFSAFFFGCHLLAAQSYGELSLAVNDDAREADVVIVAEKVDLMPEVAAMICASMTDSKTVSIEPVEEDGLKLVFYLRYDLF